MTPEFLANFTGPAAGVVLDAAAFGQEFMLTKNDVRLSMHGFEAYIAGDVISNNTVIDPVVHDIRLASSGNKSEVSITRGNQNVTVYTPNEFYNLFNRAGGADTVSPPWLLQTDENGGFAVQWKMDTSKPLTEFLISKPMCDSLGLNPYMDFDQTVSGEIDTSYMATLLSPEYLHAENDITTAMSSYIVDAPLKEVTLYPGDNAVVPEVKNHLNVVTTPRNWTWMHLVKWNKKNYYLTSVQHTTVKNGESYPSKLKPEIVEVSGVQMYKYTGLPAVGQIRNTGQISVESWGTFSMINLVIPNIPFQSMLGGESDARILASLRLPFQYGTANGPDGQVKTTEFDYYGDLLYNSDSSRSYLRITTDQQLFDCDVEARLIRRDGSMEIMQIPYKGQFQVKLRLLQTQ